METGRKAGRGRPGVTNNAAAAQAGADQRQSGENVHGSFDRAGPQRQADAGHRAGSDSGKQGQGNEFEIRNPARGRLRCPRRTARPSWWIPASAGFSPITWRSSATIRRKGWHDARVESRANFPLDPALGRPALRAGDFRRPQGLQARRRRREPVPPRRQCKALPEFGRPHGDGAAARVRVHRSGRAARAHRPAPGSRAARAVSICGPS